jgi:hypothetical protein
MEQPTDWSVVVAILGILGAIGLPRAIDSRLAPGLVPCPPALETPVPAKPGTGETSLAGRSTVAFSPSRAVLTARPARRWGAGVLLAGYGALLAMVGFFGVLTAFEWWSKLFSIGGVLAGLMVIIAGGATLCADRRAVLDGPGGLLRVETRWLGGLRRGEVLYPGVSRAAIDPGPPGGLYAVLREGGCVRLGPSGEADRPVVARLNGLLR